MNNSDINTSNEKIILSARDLCKSYATDGGQVHVVNHVDLDLFKGDFTVIMGASGSGKSTLLYSLSGMERPTAGSVLFGGKDVAKLSEKELTKLRCGAFGFVFQQIHLVSNLTIFENVSVVGYLDKERSAEETDEEVRELLKKMNILDISDHLPSQSSGGEQQRCAIARSLINKPQLLFADEPTGALNRRNTTDVLNLLSEVNGQGQSILMVTHDIKSAIRGNRLLYLSDGVIVGELTLPRFQGILTSEQEKSRETQVNAWLHSLEW